MMWLVLALAAPFILAFAYLGLRFVVEVFGSAWMLTRKTALPLPRRCYPRARGK